MISEKLSFYTIWRLLLWQLHICLWTPIMPKWVLEIIWINLACRGIKKFLYYCLIRKRCNLEIVEWWHNLLKIGGVVDISNEIFQILINRLKTSQEWLEIQKRFHLVWWSCQLNLWLWFKNDWMYSFIFILGWRWR